jgi:hypothetical protein
MKKRNFSNKLTLNKKTVSNLSTNDLQVVNGGNKTGITCAPRCDSEGLFSCVVTYCQTDQQSCILTDCYSQCVC